MANVSNPTHTLRSSLQAHVWPLHRQLDHNPTLQALTRPDLDARTYKCALAGFHIAYQHIEPGLITLEKTTKQSVLPAYQPRLPFIRREYAMFNQSEEGLTQSHTPLPPMPEFLCPLSAYLGSRYVLEGASQGTPHVIRALERYHPTWPLHPNGYWHALITQAPVWRQLCLLLDTPQTNKPVTLTELKQGATWVFESFIASLAPSTHH